MKSKLVFCLALVLSGSLFGCSTLNEPPRQYILTPDDPSERTDILSYSKPSRKTLKQIKAAPAFLTREEFSKLANLPKDAAIRGVRWLAEEKPDTMRNGPWNTRLYIFTTGETNQCVRLELIDHGNGGVNHRWLNDKMLFVTVWFGRVAWTDFILNTETLRFAYIEDGRLDAMLDAK
ncbi:MAG TPA: hypothetical protein VFZ59_20245 [Verrucomicrobiae bacterium]|nr:hypothetical protein [Verrucomicrobiae bacterium]